MEIRKPGEGRGIWAPRNSNYRLKTLTDPRTAQPGIYEAQTAVSWCQCWLELQQSQWLSEWACIMHLLKICYALGIDYKFAWQSLCKSDVVAALHSEPPDPPSHAANGILHYPPWWFVCVKVCWIFITAYWQCSGDARGLSAREGFRLVPHFKPGSLTSQLGRCQRGRSQWGDPARRLVWPVRSQ